MGTTQNQQRQQEQPKKDCPLGLLLCNLLIIKLLVFFTIIFYNKSTTIKTNGKQKIDNVSKNNSTGDKLKDIDEIQPVYNKINNDEKKPGNVLLIKNNEKVEIPAG